MRRGYTVVLKILNRGIVVPTPVNVGCDVYHPDFTSHDYPEGLAERVKLAKPGRLIVHHCDGPAFEAYKKLISSIIPDLPVKRAGHLEVIEL